MNRRQLLRRGLLLGAAGLAGCQSGDDGTPTRSSLTATATTTQAPTPTETASATQEPTDTATDEPTETATPEPPTIPPVLERTYEPSADIGSFSDVVVLSSGDYVFAGSTGSAGSSASGWLVRVGPDGSQQWARSYGGDSAQFAGVTEAGDGSIVAAGNTQTDDGTSAGFVQAVASDGAEQWSTTLDRERGNSLSAITGTRDGVLVSGIADFRDNGAGVGWAVTLDSSGSVLSERTIGDAFIRTFNAAVTLADGRYALAGASSPVRGRSNGFLVVVNSQLETEVSREYDQQVFEAFRDVAVLSDGGFLLAGDSSARRTFDNRNEDVWLVRTDSQATQQWSTTHDMEQGDRVTGVVQRDDGSFFCVGLTDVDSNGTDSAFAARVSTDGSVTETSTYGDDDELGGTRNSDSLSALTRTPDGTLVAGGLKNLGESDGTVTGLGWLLTF